MLTHQQGALQPSNSWSVRKSAIETGTGKADATRMVNWFAAVRKKPGRISHQSRLTERSQRNNFIYPNKSKTDFLLINLIKEN
jgi:hypothetical protein